MATPVKANVCDQITMRYFLFPAMILALTGCSEDVHYSAFLYGISSVKDTACWDLESKQILSETVYRDLPSEHRVDFDQKMEAAEKKCETVGDVLDDLSSTHKKLESGYRIPKKKYLFDIHSSTGFATPIGLLDTEDQCKDSRARLLNLGYELSGCYDRRVFWNSVWR